MARVFFDSVAQTSTSTGTGDMTLSTTTDYPGRRTLQSVAAVGDQVTYRIASVDTNGVETGAWETGIGTYSAANILTRTKPQQGSTAPPVNFPTGVKKVSLTINASDMKALADGQASAAFTYDADGDIATVTTNGVTSTHNYDTSAGFKRLATITSPGKTLTFNYHPDNPRKIVSTVYS